MLAKVNSSAVVGLDAIPTGTDNRICNSERIKDLDDEWRSVPTKHQSWYYKRRKGRHEFLLVREEEFWIPPGKWQIFLCSTCGKKKLKHLLPMPLKNSKDDD